MAAKVQIEYQEMENIASNLRDKRDVLQESYNRNKGALDALQGQWMSPAAAQFFDQAGSMMTRYEKLVRAAYDLVDTANEVAETLREIEEDAKSQFTWLKGL